MGALIITALFLLGLTVLLVVASVRQRRHAGDLTIEQTKDDAGKRASSGPNWMG